MLLLNRGDDFSSSSISFATLPLIHGEKVERLGSCHLSVIVTATSAGSTRDRRLHHLGAIASHSLVKSPDAIVSGLESLVLQVV